MKLFRIIAACWVLVAFASDAWAQPFDAPFRSSVSAQKDKDEKLVEASVVANVETVSPGREFWIGVLFKIAPHWHIYWHTPGELGLPTKVDWEAPKGFEIGPLEWPKPAEFTTEGILSKGYEGEVLLLARVKPPKELPGDSPIEFKASVSWLVCKTDGSCIPGDATLKAALSVGEAKPSAHAADFEKYVAQVPKDDTAIAPPEEPEGDTPEPAPTKEIKPLKEGQVFSFLDPDGVKKTEANAALMLLYAFLGGIILNIMPCVLPVLSIKILSFVRQSSDDPARIFRLGLVYALGVLASFAALATLVVLLQRAGQVVGWGFAFQEPRFVILMCAVVLAFGLSLFGVFEVDLPGSAIQNVEGLQHREGATGAFFNGILATALATPCTAPFLAPALGFAFTQPPLMIYLIFSLVAAGLALPYVILSRWPGWLKFMPKPGNWMNTFKQFMGFLLIATLVWLLSVLSNQGGGELIVWTLAFLTCVGLACWIWGLGSDLGASAGRKLGYGGTALVIVFVGYIFFPERQLRGMESAPVSESESIESHGNIRWKKFSIGLVEDLAAQNRTIFVDFTAAWCATCKVNEANAINTPEVEAAFKDYKVETLLADWTNRNEEIGKVLKVFGRSGVPMYVIFPGGNPGEPIVLPDGLITASQVVEAVKKASSKKNI